MLPIGLSRENVMPTAAEMCRENLRFFADLARRTPPPKVEFNTQTGRFQAATWRTLGNMLKRADEKQSIRNDRMFGEPIRAVFAEAARSREVTAAEIKNALDGLRALEKTYSNDPSKLDVLEAVILDAARTTSQVGAEVLALYRGLRSNEDVDRVLFQGELDRKKLEGLYNDAGVQGALRRLENELQTPSIERQVPLEFRQLIYRQYNAVDAETDQWIGAEAFAGLLPYRQGVKLQDRPGPRPQNKDEFVEAITGNPSAFIYYAQSRGGKMKLDLAYPNEELWRIYLNVRLDATALVGAATYLREQADRPANSGIVDFKIAGPRAIVRRCDRIVVYLRGQNQARRLAEKLGRDSTRSKWFADPIPMFTQRVAPGVGVGVEPLPLLTGFDPVRGGPNDGQHSYGTIRAALIATAACYYLLNRNRQESVQGVDAFVRWVAVVFKLHMRHLHPDLPAAAR